jgi:hypothetical protein
MILHRVFTLWCMQKFLILVSYGIIIFNSNMFHQKKIGFFMHNTYRIMALNILVAATSAVAMETATKSTNILSFPGVRAGAFVGNGMLIISSDSTALFPYESDENPQLPCKLKEKTRKVTNQRYNQFAVSNKGTVAGFNKTHCMIYHPEEDSITELLLIPERPSATRLRGVVFGNDDRLLVHVKDYRVENGNSLWKAIPEYNGKTLEEFNCDSDGHNLYTIDYDDDNIIPAMAFRSPHNEIIYASGDRTLSRLTIDENGNIQKKDSVKIDSSLKDPLIFRHMSCSPDGSAVVLNNMTIGGGLAFRVYNFEHKATYRCGRGNGAALYPINPFITALLKHDTVVEYCDIAMEEPVLVHSTDPIIVGQKLPPHRYFTMEFSPDGKHLFVVLVQRELDNAQDIAFLIPVPACVAAYKRIQEASK